MSCHAPVDLLIVDVLGREISWIFQLYTQLNSKSSKVKCANNNNNKKTVFKTCCFKKLLGAQNIQTHIGGWFRPWSSVVYQILFLMQFPGKIFPINSFWGLRLFLKPSMEFLVPHSSLYPELHCSDNRCPKSHSVWRSKKHSPLTRVPHPAADMRLKLKLLMSYAYFTWFLVD